jgi:hypothetical protein
MAITLPLRSLTVVVIWQVLALQSATILDSEPAVPLAAPLAV